MQQFIPFEDDWDALEQLRPEALIPYRVGFVPAHAPAVVAPLSSTEALVASRSGDSSTRCAPPLDSSR
jgi:hypothetical protein